MEEDLRGDGVEAELISDLNLLLLAHPCHEEHESVGDSLALRTHLTIIFVLILGQVCSYLLFEERNQLFVILARFKTHDLIFVLGHKFVLRANKLIRLVVIEELQDDLEERERIEVKEEAKESLIRQESHDIVDIAAPLERAK